MSKMWITNVGERKKAGNFQKQYFTADGRDGFVWIKEGQTLEIKVGDLADGDWTLKKSTNPGKYPDEYSFNGKFEGHASTAAEIVPGATGTSSITPTLSVKDLQITRQNACNVSANLMSGKGTEDIGKFWAAVRQVQYYTSTGTILKMSTKDQHAAIMAMFGKDLEKARDAVDKVSGFPYLDALSFEEAVAFLDIETPASP
jgi:hypothetical protein